MRVLAIYGSTHGQAEAVLRKVVALLGGGDLDVVVEAGDRAAGVLDPGSFDAVVIAASVILGHYQHYIRDFVVDHRDSLNERPTAFISVSGTRPESDPAWRAEAEAHVADFLESTGWRPTVTATFAGALRYPRYNWFTRLIMRRISRSHGGPTDTHREYEFTDWAAVTRFAMHLRELLVPVAA